MSPENLDKLNRRCLLLCSATLPDQSHFPLQSRNFVDKNAAPADEQLFKREVEKMVIERIVMKYGDEIAVK